MSIPEHRRFARVIFNHTARLTIAGHEHACEVVDLSLKGALLRTASGEFSPGENCRLDLVLDDGEHCVRMDGVIAHCTARLVGLACQSIDLESATLMRRLVELNLGDPDLLEREIHALVDR